MPFLGTLPLSTFDNCLWILVCFVSIVILVNLVTWTKACFLLKKFKLLFILCLGHVNAFGHSFKFGHSGTLDDFGNFVTLTRKALLKIIKMLLGPTIAHNAKSQKMILLIVFA